MTLNAAGEIRAQIEEGIALRQSVLGDASLLSRVATLAEEIVRALRGGNKILLAGNGGSFADAQHIAAEMIGRFLVERAPLAAVCLGTNGSLVTAVANDYGYADVFVRELKGLARPGDIFVAISTSGNSENLAAAVREAEKIGVHAWGFLGRDGGDIGRLLPQTSLIVPSASTPRVQEAHITFAHIVCDLVDKHLAAT